MLKIYGCFVNDHDLRFVAVAALLCILSSFTAVNLLRHARSAGRRLALLWLAVAAVSSGFGIWATHFVAMLAFDARIPSGYDLPLTALSLAAAIGTTGLGLLLASDRDVPAAPYVGGAVVGMGIGIMHYLGMAAFQVAGGIAWDPVLVAASLLTGVAFGAVALRVALARGLRRPVLPAAGLMTLAICGLHFTGMGAATIVPDPAVEIPAGAVSNDLLAIGVALAGFAILLSACGALVLDIRDRHRNGIETARMRGLADAAVEGLIVCGPDGIVAANRSFARLAGAAAEGRSLSAFLPDAEAVARLSAKPDHAVETLLRQADGTHVPVEAILQRIDFGGAPHHAVAVRDLRDRKKAEQDIRFLAHHDGLTGLPNRAAFNQRLDQEIARARTAGTRLAVLCLDLDRFKEVNDLFGHAAGDDLLRSVARCVTATLDETQLMARLGGDEFAVLVPNLSGGDTAGRIAEHILEAMRVENASSTSGTVIATSIGIAVYPDDAEDRQALLGHADTALYRAKAEGRGIYRFFEARMGAQVRERRLIEHDLRHAVARSELRLVYQPQTSVSEGRMVGFEALLRWNHRTRGGVSPGVFIPIAEESGAIMQIGEWVLRTACAEAARWSQPLRIAVNVSAVQVHSANFAELVEEVLAQTGLAPERLELEITETALVRDFDRALATLRSLKTLGVRIAMDDFGTGYSSLSNLRAFPFDKIKIDGSFIRSVDQNEQAATIVRAVLGLGRGLGLPVLAEGVETLEEMGFLEGVACDEVQGYLVGKPADIEQFAAMLGISAAVPPPEPEKRAA